MKRSLSILGCTLLMVASGVAADAPELAGYRPLSEAITAQIEAPKPDAQIATGYLGVAVEPAAGGGIQVNAVAADSPAVSAGLQIGDWVASVDGKAVTTPGDFRARLQAMSPGETVSIAVRREGSELMLPATLGATSRPRRVSGQRAVIGLRMGPGSEEPGIAITGVTPDRPAAEAGLKSGDVILRVNDLELNEARSLTDVLTERSPGESVEVLVRRKQEEFAKTIKLAADETSSLPLEERRILTPWKKDVYRMAVIGVEFPDVKHNARIGVQDWENAFFSRGTYHTNDALGQPVYGSMNDYYQETSCGRLRVEGRVFDWVEVAKNRADYNQGTSATIKAAFFNEAIDLLLAREGANALDGFDGIAFIHAGAKFPTTNRGSLFWAHRSSFLREKKLRPYVIVAEGGDRMANISTMCHETGHILGLPDLYARPENPGSEGVGSWCVMANQVRNGRPQHFSAWSKEQMGWLQPVTIDPTIRQKLILGPVEGSASECLKVLVKRDGSEYLLLENRRKIGFDASLPAEGLLIWRVVANRPILEESHGVGGPAGPRVYLPQVPYPSEANNAFTPFTTPSSRSLLGGGLPVYLTNIRQLPDGRIALEVGCEYD